MLYRQLSHYGCSSGYDNEEYGSLLGFTVISRQNSFDTITYTILQLPSGLPDTLIVTHIDSTPAVNSNFVFFKHGFTYTVPSCIVYPPGYYSYGCDTSASSCNTSFYSKPDFNNRLCSSHTNGFFESSYKVDLIEMGGILRLDFIVVEFYNTGCPGGCSLELAYYKSDSITWMDTALYLYNNIPEQTPTPTLHLSPTPANETITLSAETETASEPLNVLVYDITGACVRNIQTSSIRSLTIPVNDLSPGYYVIKVSNSNHYLAAKGFIIAR